MSERDAIRLPNYVHRYVLYTLGLEAPMWTYKAGQWLCAPSDSELGTRSSGLGVPLSSVEHGGRVAGDLRGTLDIDPNPNGILLLHRSQSFPASPSPASAKLGNHLPGDELELCVLQFEELSCPYVPNNRDIR